jgi:hypothetical protein
MGDRISPFGYLLVGFLGVIIGAASMVGLSRLIPNMMVDFMKKMMGGGEPPEFCKKMMEKCSCGDEPAKPRAKKRKK